MSVCFLNFNEAFVFTVTVNQTQKLVIKYITR